KEIRDYLIKKEISEDAIPEIIDRLISEGLVNDLEFAKMFTRTRIETSLKGPAVVKRELIEKGVATELAEEAIQLYTYDIQYEKAYKLIEKKINQTQKDSNFKMQQKLQQFMMQKGFSSDIIQELMQDVKENQSDEDEKEAVMHQGEKLKRKYQRKYTGTELIFKIKTGLYRYGFSGEMIEEYLHESLSLDEEEPFRVVGLVSNQERNYIQILKSGKDCNKKQKNQLIKVMLIFMNKRYKLLFLI